MRSRAASAAVMVGAALMAARGGAAWAEEAGGEASAEAKAPPWTIETSAELALAPGQVAATKVVLHGRGRHRVSPSGLRLDLATSGPGISVRQRRYLRADASERAGESSEQTEAVFSIPVRGEAVGSYDLEVRARFWVCTPRSCRPVDERRRIAVTVSEPAPVVAPAAAAAAELPAAAPEGSSTPAKGPARPTAPSVPAKSRPPAKGKPAKPFR